MEVVTLIIEIVLVLCALFLIAVVLLQSGKKAGVSGSIGGGAEAFFGKKKARGFEAKMNLYTTVTAIAFMVLAVVLVLLQKIAG